MAYLSESTSAIPNLQQLQSRLGSRHLFLGGLDDNVVITKSWTILCGKCPSVPVRASVARDGWGEVAPGEPLKHEKRCSHNHGIHVFLNHASQHIPWLLCRVAPGTRLQNHWMVLSRCWPAKCKQLWQVNRTESFGLFPFHSLWACSASVEGLETTRSARRKKCLSDW